MTRGTILLCGKTVEPVMANICARLAVRDCDLLLVDPAQDPAKVHLAWGACNGTVSGTLRLGERCVDVSAIRSVYLREVGWCTRVRPGRDTDEATFKTEALWECLDALPQLVVNRRQAVYANGSKPYQQSVIGSYGFRVPRTLVTMVPEQAKAFYEAHAGRVIYKSISGERSIVQRISLEDLDRLDQIRHCPVQFQEWIPGVDVRVHVVGRRLFASEVISNASDYRYAHREGARRLMRAVDLDPELSERCLSLAHSMGLPVAGIDLRRTPEGEYVCFEVNPSPAFLWFEQVTGQRIGDAIAELLIAGMT